MDGMIDVQKTDADGSGVRVRVIDPKTNFYLTTDMEPDEAIGFATAIREIAEEQKNA